MTTSPEWLIENLAYGKYEVNLQPAGGQSTPEAVQLAVSDEPNEELLFWLDESSSESQSQIFLPLVTR